MRLFSPAPTPIPGQLAMDAQPPADGGAGPDVGQGGGRMSTYRERRERKAKKLRDWADSRDRKADSARDSADRIMDAIPPGQPILAGHHSEKRHRRDIERLDRAMVASVEHAGKADTFRRRADNIEAAAERAIYSDDHDAVERLRERVAELEAQREWIKRYNATCRKGAPDPAILSAEQRAELASCISVWGDVQCKGGRFPSYVLTNLGGNISRQRKRLEALEAQPPPAVRRSAARAR
jgi:Domain of unknown function (DUF3560)